jgi:hypothetical protein
MFKLVIKTAESCKEEKPDVGGYLSNPVEHRKFDLDGHLQIPP